MKVLIFTILIYLISCIEINSQTSDNYFEPRTQLGIFSDYNFNQHFADFRALPNIPNCCPLFTQGKNESFAGTFGILLDFLGVFQIRPSYYMWDGVLKNIEKTKGGINGKIVDVEIEHTINTKIRSAGLEFIYGVNLFNNFYLNFGARGDYYIEKTFTQKEQLIKPTDFSRFENGTRTRNFYSLTEIPNVNKFSFSGLAGISSELSLNNKRTIRLVPEILATYNFTPVVQNYKWNIFTIRAGFSLKFSLSNQVDILNLKFNLLKNDKSNKIINLESIDIKESYFNYFRPLLFYIFFENGSSDIPKRYKKITKKQTKEFKLDAINNTNTLEIYTSILNILGYRMNQYPKAKIIINGCNSNKEIEYNNLSLSRKRAEIIKDYLINVWNIENNRININVQNLPDNPTAYFSDSMLDQIDGEEENRRVEITSDTYEITEPLNIIDTKSTISPDSLIYQSDIESNNSINKWEIDVNSGNKEIISKSGKNIVNNYSFILNLNDNLKNILESRSNYLISTFIVENNDGKNYKKEITTPIHKLFLGEQSSMDNNYDEYRLILFPFNSSNIEEFNQNIIKFIKNKLKPGTIIKITGYTDRVGNDSSNLELSFNRANSVFNELKLNQSEFLKIAVDGKGEKSPLLYDNNLPEGRFYCRTVIISIYNPKKR
jgi:outer membrane protein OmpA-like peptidoglycan-associated protein